MTCGRVAFEYDGMFLRMRLPSGRRLAYPFPQLRADDRGNLAVVFMDNAGGKWTECRGGHGAYGGTWIENAVQAVARDLFAASMLRLEAAGYEIVLHVHDEIVAEVPDDFGTAEQFLQILTASPSWADGLPIAAKVRSGQRFCKITPRPQTAAIATVNAVATDESGKITTGDGVEPKDHQEAKPGDEYSNDREDHPSDSYAAGERAWGHNIARYIYRDAGGAPYLCVVRTSAKQFPQYHWDNGPGCSASRRVQRFHICCQN